MAVAVSMFSVAFSRIGVSVPGRKLKKKKSGVYVTVGSRRLRGDGGAIVWARRLMSPPGHNFQ